MTTEFMWDGEKCALTEEEESLFRVGDEVSDRVFELMDAQMMTHKDFAKKLGKSPQWMRKFLAGDCLDVPVSLLSKMAFVLGVRLKITFEEI